LFSLFFKKISTKYRIQPTNQCECVMDDVFLWTVDYHGSLHKLNLSNLKLNRVHPLDPTSRKHTFKRIASSVACVWAIAADHNVYVRVHMTDLPIVVTECCYENQRWYFSLGFSSKSVSTYISSKYITN
jgi:hypothetical protein